MYSWSVSSVVPTKTSNKTVFQNPEECFSKYGKIDQKQKKFATSHKLLTFAPT